MPTAAIYARVSSEKQEQEKTIDSQIAVLRDACERDGMRVIEEYVDDGVSGATLARPALDRLRDDAARGLFETVYILSPDRLARKYLYQALVLDELRKRGIRAVFMNSPATDRPEDQLLLGIQGVIAEYERAQLAERVRRGKLYRAKTGALQTSSPTYGYRLIRRTDKAPARYAIDEEQAAAVRSIFGWYVKYRSSIRVAAELHRRGIPSPRGREYWLPCVINRMLRFEAYIGTAYYNKTSGNGRRRERSEWVPIPVPAIVDPEIFRLAQRILDQNGGGKKRRLYLLSRLVTCKHCGGAYSGDSSNQYRSRYYRCANARRQFPRPRTCPAKMVRSDRLEEAVIDAIRGAVLRPEILLRHVVGLAARTKGPGARGTDAGRLRAQRASIEDRRARLLDLYLDESVAKEDFKRRDSALERRQQECNDRLRRLEQAPRLDARTVRDRVRRFCATARERFNRLAGEELQHFLRLIVDEVVYDWKAREARVVGHIPAGSLAPDQFAGGDLPANWAATVRFAIRARVAEGRMVATA